MSLPWSGKEEKSTGEEDDEILILDSTDSDPDTINKRLKLSNLPGGTSGVSDATNLGTTGSEVFAQKNVTILEFRKLIGDSNRINLAQNDDDITFTLDSVVVTTDKSNTYGANFAQIFPDDQLFIQNPNADATYQIIADAITTDRTLTLPLLTGNDIFVTETFPQTLTDKTIDVINDSNVIKGLTLANAAADNKVVGASTDLTNSSDIPLLSVLNDFTEGTKSQFFLSESGTPAETGILRLARVDDIAWRNQNDDDELLLQVDINNFLTFPSLTSFVAVTSGQGTSGQVLTSNGAGSDPTFEDATDGVFPVSDEVMIIEGSSTPSKKIKFDVDTNITDSQTRVITPPDANITLVNTSDGNITNSNLTSGSFTKITGVGTLTAGTWSATTIVVASGGTGATTFNANGVLIGNTTGIVNSTSAGTSGEILTSNGAGSDPTFQSTSGIFPVSDNTVIIEGSDDDTKQLRFEVDGNDNGILGILATTFSTVKTLTFPDAADVLVGKATTDIFTNKTFDANGTGNSLSNVDVEDLANGTDGELITWDSSGIADTVATGTSGQILTGNGVGTAPTFQNGVFFGITGLGIQSQALDMNTNKITSLDTPTDDTDAATKGYVDLVAADLEETFTWPLTDELSIITTGTKYTTEPAPYDVILDESIVGLTVAGTGAIQATGTATLSGVVATNSLTVNGLTYTAVSATPNNTEFLVEVSNTDTAINLAAAITNDTREGITIPESVDTALSAGAIVTITAGIFGADGNTIGLTTNSGNFTLSGSTLGTVIAGSGDLLTIDILKENAVNDNNFTSIFSTLPTVNEDEFTSTTAPFQPVLSTTTWERGRRLRLEINTLDTDNAAKGVKATLVVHRGL